MVGQDAKGLACYWKEPDRTDASVEANILASFAGFYAEKRLRAISGSQARDYFAAGGDGQLPMQQCGPAPWVPAPGLRRRLNSSPDPQSAPAGGRRREFAPGPNPSTILVKLTLPADCNSSGLHDGVPFAEVSLGYPREWRRRSHVRPSARHILPEKTAA